MKYKFLVYTFFGLIFFTGCNGNENKLSEEEKKENELLDTEEAKSVVKDSIIYFNGNQKTIELNENQYFGFLFEADDQNLEWVLDPSIDQNLAYVSESYEPEFGNEKKKLNGKQFFTFQTLKKGKSTVKFVSKNKEMSKLIEIVIK